MKARMRLIWETLRASYWFLPSLMSILAIVFSFVTLWLDETIRYKILQEQGWVYSGGPQGARAVLATIAGSIITVAGTTFSITIAVLSMASAQFGPRLLRNFMRDRGNQIVLGAFVATFLYCLLVLRTVRGTDQDTYVPHLSVTIGVLLAIGSLSALIFFIHHVAESIQVSNMIGKVGEELDDSVRRLFPAAIGDEADPVSLPQEEPQTIAAKSSGYIQDVDEDTLLSVAKRAGAILRLKARPGDYLIAGMPVAEMWTIGTIKEDDQASIRDSFSVGLQRTPYQDAECAFLQLVELAVRALSPGINDPFTAVMCIDRISSAFCLLADRSLPSPDRRDEEGRVRVVAQPYRYDQLVHSAFSQIIENGKSHTVIVERLLRQLDVILSRTNNVEFRSALEHEKEQLPGGMPTVLSQ
ncbi:MAG: DUF2254 domain-containing protein [Bryobacteraceae bacterium]